MSEDEAPQLVSGARVGSRVMLLANSPLLIIELARRIKQAYSRRLPAAVSPRKFDVGVWNAAAALLWDLHRADPWVPLDPEFFVASQNLGPSIDPWRELVLPSAARRYRSQVHRIVRQLRRELRTEVRRGERQLMNGLDIEEIVLISQLRISPLGRFVLALQMGRPDLAELIRPAAEDQQRACPLYGRALATLVPSGVTVDATPIEEQVEELGAEFTPSRRRFFASGN